MRPLGFRSKKQTGALMIFSRRDARTWIAARRPPNAKENALPNVKRELIMPNVARIICRGKVWMSINALKIFLL